MEPKVSFGEALSALGDGILWVIVNIGQAFYNFGYAVTHPMLWLDWSDKTAVMRVIYYGGSVEFFFVVFTLFLVVTFIGMLRTQVMWGVVRGLEGLANTVGRFAAWAGLLMVLQQVIIVFIQRIFLQNSISIGIGIPIEYDLIWWAEELKLYNAMIVSLCLAYTFVQGGHVRVDLLYAPARYRTKKLIDMFGSLFFMMPMAVVIWLYSWFFLWRSLIDPNPAAAWNLMRTVRSARVMKWNVETIAFNPSGFTAYFLFKVLIVTMCGMIFLQAVAFFYRSYLEWREGEESEGKYLDKDVLDQGETPAGNH